jgi:hypothetical protein
MTGSPPVVPVFAAGYPYLPSDFDNLIQAPLIFQTTGCIFRASRTSTQSFSSGNNIVEYNTILEDPYSGWNATDYYWLAPFTGWYSITVVSSAISGTGIEWMTANIITPEFYFTGCQSPGVNDDYPVIASATAILPLIGGTDWIKGGIYVSASTSAPTTDDRQNTMEITFVSQ